MTSTTDPREIKRSTRPRGRRRGLLPLRSKPSRVLIAIGALIIVVVVVGAVAGSVTRSSETGVQQPSGNSPVPATLDSRISELERRARRSPDDGNAFVALGSAHIRKVYETGDPSSYAAAQSAVQKARSLLGDSPESLLVAANLALSQHRFGEALELARRVHADQPNRAAVLMPLIDANVETGHYDDARMYVTQLVELRPSVAALSRRSYLRQLGGDLEGAAADMRQAVQAAPTGTIDQAVALGYLGDVELERGNLKKAQRAYDRALAISPRLPHAVLGRAFVDVGLGNLEAASSRLDVLNGSTPLPGAIAMRAELARGVGDATNARVNDELFDATASLYEASGAVLDVEFAIALADRGDPRAVVVAQRAYDAHHTIFTADALGWSLYRAGRAVEAAPYAQEAIATDPAVGSIHAHAALIFATAGDTSATDQELRKAHRSAALMLPLPKLLRQLSAGRQ